MRRINGFFFFFFFSCRFVDYVNVISMLLVGPYALFAPLELGLIEMEMDMKVEINMKLVMEVICLLCL